MAHRRAGGWPVARDRRRARDTRTVVGAHPRRCGESAPLDRLESLLGRVRGFARARGLQLQTAAGESRAAA
jgi:hypothetical protein